MRIWLDDVRPMPEGFDVHCRTVDEVEILLDSRKVTFISFDHDLGENQKTGYDLACTIETMVGLYGFPRIGWAVHSANPVGRHNIMQAMNFCEAYWNSAVE